MLIETIILQLGYPDAISRAVQVLRTGGLVAFPTDTVYGLSATINNPGAIEKLFQVKGRDTNKAIAILLGDVHDLELVTEGMDPAALRLAARFWPGSLTLVVSRHPALPAILSPLPTIGVRIPDHPVALELLKQTGPLAVTSANLSGASNATAAAEVFSQLQGKIDLILDGGRTPGGVPSTVVDCTTSKVRILRQGPVTQEQITAVLDDLE